MTTTTTLNNRPSSRLPFPRTRIQTTLLDLVQAVNQLTDDDQVVVATIAHLVNSGQARLTGTFKNARVIIS